MYVRQSSNPADPKPYQVRRNRPDQTYDVLARYASAAAAYRHVDRARFFAATDRREAI